MKRPLNLLIIILIFIMIALPIFFIRYNQNLISDVQTNQNLISDVQTNVPQDFYKTHILGGFSIDSPEKVTKAATDTVQVVFKYDQPPSEGDSLGKKLKSLHMKVVDGYIWSLLYYYECHRTKLLKPSLLGQGQYCQNDPFPYLDEEAVLLASVAAHLKQVKDNRLIIGYWVLDDWVSWDAGSARELLKKIHHLIWQYTPDRPTICGFGGDIWLNQEYGWDDWIAANFSPQGCDRVGLYVYMSPAANTTRISPHATINWSMARLLPAIFASLKQRGWNITKEPLIGIVQAFGGPIAHTDSYRVTPTAKDIETQSRSFCEHGATGLTFYAWNDSGYGPTTQTPMNSPEIEKGIRNGIAACKQYWSKHL